jgi:26S proteasome regulatory subunit N13
MSELVHFCWRSRNVPLTQAETDLVMVPGDGHFVPYDSKAHSNQGQAKTNGRIFVLKFASSSARHLFWLQSKPQGHSGAQDWFSPRDRKIGEIVDRLLQGEDVEVTRELAQIRNNNDDSRGDGDDDEPMEDVEGHGDSGGAQSGSFGGAGPGATGGDIREEGEDAREGGGDGARA